MWPAAIHQLPAKAGKRCLHVKQHASLHERLRAVSLLYAVRSQNKTRTLTLCNKWRHRFPLLDGGTKWPNQALDENMCYTIVLEAVVREL
jgi:hypothetical protein